jgi:hypothetical protein
VVWFLRFQARVAVPVLGEPSARGRQTVHEVLFVQVFFVYFASYCFTSFRFVESVVFVWRKLVGQSAWGGRTVRAARTVGGALPDRPLFEVCYWRFGFHFLDRPPVTCGLSARTTRTVRPVPRRAAKFFASCVSLSL